MRVLAVLMLLAAWGCLSYGASLVYQPAGWVSLGACLWVDFYFGRRLRSVR